MGDGGWGMEDGGWRMEDGGWRMGDGGWGSGGNLRDTTDKQSSTINFDVILWKR